MTEALVNPRLLIWARERARLEDDAMATALKVPLEKVRAWERGEKRPSFGQAERWAQVTHTPFGLLFVSEPPAATRLPPDFRRVDGAASEPSPEFVDLFDDVSFKHAWFRAWRQEHGFPPVAFVGSASKSISPERLAAEMKKALGVESAERVPGVEDRYRQLIAAAEGIGIWVLRSGTVAGNTHRPVPVEQFRGFAIADVIAPLVFINARDAATAQLFTLVHELAHLWLGATGVSDPFSTSDNAVERLCNAAAAEFLVPATELRARWNKDEQLDVQSSVLAREFKVSPAVVAIRARGLGLTSQRALDEFLGAQRASFKRRESDSGGDFYRTAISRNGRFFARAVLSAAMALEISLTEGGQLLNVNASKVVEVARREGLTR